MVTNFKNQSRSCKQNKRKEKQEERDILKSTSFLLQFFLGQSLGLGNCSLRESLVCAFGVTFGRYWKTGKDNLHPRCLLVFGRILGNSRGLSGIRGHFLSHLSILSIHPRLLGHFWKAARGERDLVGATFLGICNLGRGVCLGAIGGRDTNGWGGSRHSLSS